MIGKMPNWLSCLFVVIGLAAGLAGPAASKWLLPSFSDVVESSARIARIRILEVQPIRDVNGDAKEICGYRYVAVVKEAFKGESGELTFVSASDDDFDGLSKDYLVFVFEHSEAAAARLIGDPVNSESEIDLVANRFRCGSSDNLFHVMSWPQTMIPIEPSDIGRFVDGSLLVNRINPFSGLEIEVEEVVRSTRGLGMIDWRTARAMLKKELAGGEVPHRR